MAENAFPIRQYRWARQTSGTQVAIAQSGFSSCKFAPEKRVTDSVRADLNMQALTAPLGTCHGLQCQAGGRASCSYRRAGCSTQAAAIRPRCAPWKHRKSTLPARSTAETEGLMLQTLSATMIISACIAQHTISWAVLYPLLTNALSISSIRRS